MWGYEKCDRKEKRKCENMEVWRYETVKVRKLRECERDVRV